MEMNLDHGPLVFEERGSGRPFLLLNGLPFGMAEFAEVMDVLSWSSRAIAVNLPGVGGSAPLADPNPKALADVLLFSFAKLGIDTMVIGCTDVAGPVVYEILAQQPGVVAGVLFFNTPIVLKGLRRPAYFERSKTTVVDLFRSGRRLENEIKAVMGKPERLDEERLEQAVGNLPRQARKTGAMMFERMANGSFPAWGEELKRFRKPMRLLWGARDPLLERHHLDAFRRLLPGVPVHLDESAGHFLGIEAPDLLGQALQELGREAWS